MKAEEESQHGSENLPEAPCQQAISPLEEVGNKTSISVAMIAATIKAFQIFSVQAGIVSVIPV